MIKESKQVSFYKKNSVIITSLKVKTYIFKANFPFEDTLTSAPKHWLARHFFLTNDSIILRCEE